MSFSEEQFIQQVNRNDTNRWLLDVLPDLRLPQGTLTAGCLFQTVWNIKSGNKPEWGIKDYDVFYFDANDLSWEAEDAVIQTAREMLGDLADKVEIRNQARVHLWYPQKFGSPCPQLKRVEDGIDRYLIKCTQFGISIGSGKVYAPDGFNDMWDGILRINPNNPLRMLFLKKSQEYRARWPWLKLVL
ncbi:MULTISPECIES: nucleotidyltransferase family protein [unclassified Rhizobium]|uniref:nucleotidyltransferase family protein n=1 Tax=unclassified Rhizobium TaxID=2613769 RepID=UPI0025D7F0D8|nr:nucleotidyltransferase family protein [Rhizobium sp. UBA1881]